MFGIVKESLFLVKTHLPYRKLTREEYAYDVMIENRSYAVRLAKRGKSFGLIQGTIGRQGNSKIFEVLSLLCTLEFFWNCGVVLSFVNDKMVSCFWFEKNDF